MTAPGVEHRSGPYKTLHACQVVAADHYALERRKKWGRAACIPSRGRAVRFTEKTLPVNLRPGKVR